MCIPQSGRTSLATRLKSSLLSTDIREKRSWLAYVCRLDCLGDRAVGQNVIIRLSGVRLARYPSRYGHSPRSNSGPKSEVSPIEKGYLTCGLVSLMQLRFAQYRFGARSGKSLRILGIKSRALGHHGCREYEWQL